MSAITNLHRTLVRDEKAMRRTALTEALQMQAVGHLACGVAHDLNNLVAAILCNTAILHRKLRDNRAAEGELEALESSAKAAAQIANSLLLCHDKCPSRSALSQSGPAQSRPQPSVEMFDEAAPFIAG